MRLLDACAQRARRATASHHEGGLTRCMFVDADRHERSIIPVSYFVLVPRTITVGQEWRGTHDRPWRFKVLCSDALTAGIVLCTERLKLRRLRNNSRTPAVPISALVDWDEVSGSGCAHLYQDEVDSFQHPTRHITHVMVDIQSSDPRAVE